MKSRAHKVKAFLWRCALAIAFLGTLAGTLATAAPRLSGCKGVTLPQGAWPADRDICLQSTPLHQGETIRFRWAQTWNGLLSPSMFFLQGKPGAVTALDVYKSKNGAPTGRSIYSLTDDGTSGYISDTAILPPGKYIFQLSCGRACTADGDTVRLEVVRLAAGESYFTEHELKHAKSGEGILPLVFDVVGNLGSKGKIFTWFVPKKDAVDWCWSIDLILPVDSHGWVKLFDPKGRLMAEHHADAR